MLRKLTYNATIKDIIDVINALVEGYLYKQYFKELSAPPDNPHEGMVVWADGTNWNPGSGAGLYEYRGGAWNKL